MMMEEEEKLSLSFHKGEQGKQHFPMHALSKSRRICPRTKGFTFTLYTCRIIKCMSILSWGTIYDLHF